VSNAVYERASWKISLVDTDSGDTSVVQAPIVLVAAGAWSARTLQQFGVSLAVKYIKGSMFVIKPALSGRILCISKLPVSGDILVPCGAASLLGSTWEEQDDPEPTPPSRQELQRVMEPLGSILSCDLRSHITHAYSGVRVVLAQPTKRCPEGWDRTPQGTFILDHESEHCVPGLLSAFGGKLATHLETATAVVDLALQKLGRRGTQSVRLAALPPADRKPARGLDDLGDWPYHWRVDK
jgi:glycerol-3-phosphate dehydrogenase